MVTPSSIRIKKIPNSSETKNPTTMASQGKKKVPGWMGDWLRTPVFEVGRRCNEHGYQYETIFCHVCMGRTFCPICWKNSKGHENHDYIQVTACSNRTAVLVSYISKFWDVSLIQDYTINSKKVVFLNTDKKPTQKQQSNGKPTCRICSRNLIESKFRFCSIACNKQMVECESTSHEYSMPDVDKPECSMSLVQRLECLTPVVQKLESLMPMVQKPECSMPKVQKILLSLRPQHRKRKGVPRRSPFF